MGPLAKNELTDIKILKMKINFHKPFEGPQRSVKINFYFFLFVRDRDLDIFVSFARAFFKGPKGFLKF